MKKKILFLMLILMSILSFSCSSDNGNNNQNEVHQKLIGKWYFKDPTIYGYATNNSFTFTSDNRITYLHWSGLTDNDFGSEIGSFSVNGEVLTMIFPETVELRYIQKLKFINSNKVEFVQVEGSSEEAWEGVYYKEGSKSTPEQSDYSIEMQNTDPLDVYYTYIGVDFVSKNGNVIERKDKDTGVSFLYNIPKGTALININLKNNDIKSLQRYIIWKTVGGQKEKVGEGGYGFSKEATYSYNVEHLNI